jgi:predicted ATPase with chaperone activity
VPRALLATALKEGRPELGRHPGATGACRRLEEHTRTSAHHGALFLDELAEFPRAVLDNLRQPLEEGRVVVCRASAAAAFPARFLLVAAMNACRCGADGSPGSCRCPAVSRARYAGRVSGPLLDRFDLRVRVCRPDVEDLLSAGPTAGDAADERSSAVAVRVARARALARGRGVRANAELPVSALDELAPLRCSGSEEASGAASSRGPPLGARSSPGQACGAHHCGSRRL